MSMSRDYQSLQKIDKHPGFFKNEVSQKIYWRGTIRGRAFKKATGTTKITEAKKIVEDFRLALTTDNLDKAKRERIGIVNPSLEVLWHELIRGREATKSRATLVVYEKEWRLKLKPFWGEKNLGDISQSTLTEFENWFLKEFPNRSYFNTGKCLTMLLNYLHSEGYLSKKYKTRKLDTFIAGSMKKKKVFRVYSDAELRKILEAMPTQLSKLALALLMDTGARKMEILSLKWEDIDLSGPHASIWSDKNDNWRKVPLTKRTASLLRETFGQGISSEFIFPMVTDPLRHISGQLFDKDWKTAKESAKIQGRARVHDLRHTFATKTARDGWPIPIACAVLDMSTKVYISTYVHIDENDIKNWIRKTFDGGKA